MPDAGADGCRRGHISEEQDEIFPRIRRRMDIEEVGARLGARREELTAEPVPVH